MFEEIGVDNEKVQEFVKGEYILVFINDNQEKIEEIIVQFLPMEKVAAYIQSEEVDKINNTYKEVVSEINNNIPVEVKKFYKCF